MLDRLVADGRLEPAERDRALTHARRMDIRAEDAVVDTGALGEEELLRYLASIYRTRFVGTRKLARAKVGRATLQRVPPKAADKLGVCPVVYDEDGGVLSVVAAHLEAGDLGKEVQMVSSAREVRVLVAMPAAVRAAIRKHYHGDPRAFAALEASSADDLGIDWGPTSPPSTDVLPVIEPPSAPAPEPEEPARAEPPASPSGVSWEDFLESLNVLVALLEQGRGELRGHTALVARLGSKLGRRLGVASDDLHAIRLAAYLHDVGKASSYHLTAFNVAQYEGHRVQAEKSYQAPIGLFDQVELPELTVRVLTHLYERPDGRGFPAGLRGKDIPLGARLLAVVESYADLLSNSKNPFRRPLSPQEACEALEELRDAVFDGAVLDALRHEVFGDELRARLLADRRKVLLVDPDAEETTVLEMRLMEHGHEVVVARTTADATAHLAEGDVDVLVSEVDVPPDGGFALASSARQQKDFPVLFLTRRGDRESIGRGFELGAADYLVKPASAEVVVAKIGQVLERAHRPRGARGVTGSLTEMALPDVVQILSNGRKTGCLTVHANGMRGDVWFGDGEIHDARFGQLEGAEAFYQLLKLSEGDFELEASVAPPRRTIHQSSEALLLEGMRRLDEGELG